MGPTNECVKITKVQTRMARVYFAEKQNSGSIKKRQGILLQIWHRLVYILSGWMIVMERELQIPSPCVGVCQINATTKFCLGCLRTLREVAHWSRYSNEEKHEVLQELIRRRKAHGMSQRRITRRTRRKLSGGWIIDIETGFIFTNSGTLEAFTRSFFCGIVKK